MREWISVDDKKAPFAKEVEVKTEKGEVRKDMMIPVGSYAVYWAGCNYSKLDKPTHWREYE